MSGFCDPSVHVVSWRYAASSLNLCDRCGDSYTTARFCDGCLRSADADLSEKRRILFPQAYDASDLLSTFA
jgi:hypothetical protein